MRHEVKELPSYQVHHPNSLIHVQNDPSDSTIGGHENEAIYVNGFPAALHLHYKDLASWFTL